MSEDLSVAGPGSPISMKKALKEIGAEKCDKKMYVFIDNSNAGFELDEPSLLPVTVENRIIQAEWYRENIHPKQRDIPAYLFRYLLYMFQKSQEYGKTKYSDIEFRQKVQSGEINVNTDEDFCYVYNLITYSKSNKAVEQMIGLIILIAGTLRAATKAGSGVRFFIEHPETHMHPQQQAKLVSLINMLSDEYGPKEMKTTIKTEEDE